MTKIKTMFFTIFGQNEFGQTSLTEKHQQAPMLLVKTSPGSKPH